MTLQAVIFDLDGVITDTAEFHFLAWQKLAHDAGINFTREDNEQLRGVSRRESLLFILGLENRTVDEATLEKMMAEKNDTYIKMLDDITPDDMLAGVAELLNSLDAAAIPFGLGSASKNAETVLRRLGIIDRFKVIADGLAPGRKKPAPDLFLYAASQMKVQPKHCLVVEDAASGVQAAQAAGMAALALGPAERFDGLLDHPRTQLRDDLRGVTAEILKGLV